MLNDEFVYVVTRDGRRVSHKNHETRDEALHESKYWTNFIHKVVNGRKVDPRSVIRIVKTNKPKKIK